MKVCVHLPIDLIEPEGEFQTPAAIAEMAQLAERLGYDGTYLTEHPAPDADWLHNDPAGHDALDPLVALAAIGAVTSKLLLNTNIVVLPYRNPFLIAKSAATLQVVSGGRLILGVGVGYQKGEFEALGVPFNKRGALTDEALEVIRLAWAGGPVVYKGMGFNAAGNEPRPVPKPAPPIWVGGGTDAAVERAARWGDGWTPFFAVPTKDEEVERSAVHGFPAFEEKLKRLHERRAELGKTGPFDICNAAQARLKHLNAEEAERYIAAVDDLRQVGVNWIRVILPGRSRAAFTDAAEWFAAEVMARLPGRTH